MANPAAAFLLSFPIAAMAQPGPVLFDFENGFSLASAKAFGAATSLDTRNGNTGLAIAPKDAAAWEGATLTFPAKDLSAHLGIVMTVRNNGAKSVGLYAHVNEDNSYPSNQGYLMLDPGETDTLYVHFNRNKAPAYMATYLKGMKGLPGGYTEHWEIVDLTRVTQVQVDVFNPGPGRGFVIDDVRAWGTYAPPAETELKAGFFPLLDTLGQYRHASWPGKIAGYPDMAMQAEAESDDLMLHPGPTGWDAYGGWAAGPKQDATGRFRTQKVDGKWWLVDPDGRLFWSMGITCVNSGETTPVSGRENYFTSPPANGDFRGANLKRKLGSTWYARAAAMAHQRFRSWGANTMGNWSDKGIYGLKKTVYTVNFATGLNQTLPATIDTAAFRSAVQAKLTALKKELADDPWCLGVFSDNELNWPAATAAAISEDYYRICSQEMKAILPGVLYLGSRIHVAPEAVWRSAGKYCDVVSFNHYEYSISDLGLPAEIDKPVMLTEFHYGALDRGLPHPGLRTAFNQKQRARLYGGMVDQCLLHAKVVGAHWFQYSDQVYTGRGDGENYQIGFLDLCDRPYPEMVATARAISERLYVTRTGGAIPQPVQGRGKAMVSLQGPFPKVPVDALGRSRRLAPVFGFFTLR
ncbi:MAG: putative hydrolase [Fibrobacteres bacterium]|nr:putative hydrolase [Fibrobacterota bacterium]